MCGTPCVAAFEPPTDWLWSSHNGRGTLRQFDKSHGAVLKTCNEFGKKDLHQGIGALRHVTGLAHWFGAVLIVRD
jgi:hypothetical protein